ncbi:MAG: triose-phosphate isomerase [Pseudomonadota bacterium]
MRRRLAAGNWKMHGGGAELAQVTALLAAQPTPECQMLICPPATLVARMADLAKGGALMVGGQDCHPAAKGAHTGDIAASMLADAGATHVILGHSERRADHGESDALVHEKTRAAWDAGLVAIVCVGETLAEREAGRTLDIVGGQMAGSIPDAATGANLVVAYEPVWAIGTGLTPTTEQIGEVHAHMRGLLEARFGADAGQSVRLLYGGSVKPTNAEEIFAVGDVDGALVGGASLKADDFGPIVAALSASGG